MAKAAKKANNKGFEETLWDSANKLRGSVESSEYKHIVLSLIFLKFISDKFETRRQELVDEGQEQYADMVEYDFTYPEDQLIELAKEVKDVVDDKAKYTDWSQRDDVKAELKVGLILLLAKFGYPPVDRDEVYKEIFEQAESFKKHRSLSA